MKQLAYISSKLLFYIFSILYIFIMVFSILSYFEYKFDIQIPFVEVFENHSKIKVPLLGLNIGVPFNYSILIMWSAMSYYAVYFYSFKEFLKVFVKKKMFETKSLKRLQLFLILNVIPLIYIIIFIISFLIRGAAFRLVDDYFIVFAHLVIAFLIYLYLDVLKKGKYIQEENDLTI
ncbi:DUF2975 domain-containing protein [Flavivirga jejuensis]|uniref:DUF2975 domain-containing protein n=1 Tax=Flavivirga jejuensis TaxID=870487 RepID=A0ABT8WHW1_9FLAO|nr:DUF2975 domain-containing protein [Flavivirga jejuensis]MDO5972741.1 DUF2975 domain-containing protein [Flavivirga jejuensis]